MAISVIWPICISISPFTTPRNTFPGTAPLRSVQNELRLQVLCESEPVEQAGRIGPGRRTRYRIAIADRPGREQGSFECLDIADVRFGRPLADGHAKRNARNVDEAPLDDLAIARQPLKLRSGYDDHIRGVTLVNPAGNCACRTIFNCCRVTR